MGTAEYIDKEGADQTVQMCMLTWVFDVCIRHKGPFLMLCMINKSTVPDNSGIQK